MYHLLNVLAIKEELRCTVLSNCSVQIAALR